MPHPAERVFLGDIVTPGEVLRNGYVASECETIAAMGQGTPPAAAEVVHRAGADPARDRRRAHAYILALGWPGIETTTRSAAAGGVTTSSTCRTTCRAGHGCRVLGRKIAWS